MQLRVAQAQQLSERTRCMHIADAYHQTQLYSDQSFWQWDICGDMSDIDNASIGGTREHAISRIRLCVAKMCKSTCYCAFKSSVEAQLGNIPGASTSQTLKHVSHYSEDLSLARFITYFVYQEVRYTGEEALKEILVRSNTMLFVHFMFRINDTLM